MKKSAVRKCTTCTYSEVASLREPCYTCLNASTSFDPYPEWVAKQQQIVPQHKEQQDGCKE